MLEDLKKKLLDALNLEEKKNDTENREQKAETSESAEQIQVDAKEKIKESDCKSEVFQKVELGATVVGETIKSGCEAIAQSRVVEYGEKTIDAAGEAVENAGKKVIETGKKIINTEQVKEIKNSIKNIGDNIDSFAQKGIDNIKEKIKKAAQKEENKR